MVKNGFVLRSRHVKEIGDCLLRTHIYYGRIHGGLSNKILRPVFMWATFRDSPELTPKPTHLMSSIRTFAK